MDDAFKIFVDRLKENQSESLEESFSPGFMEIQEKELAFEKPIELEGKAFVSGDSLMILASVRTKALLPCAICNQPVEVDIEITDFAHTEKVEDIKSGVFNYRSVLREALLLELPHTAECANRCPKREELSKYFSKDQNKSYPFEEL